MRISDLRDWPSCLKSISQRLSYSNFKASVGEIEEEIEDRVLVLSEEIDLRIAEGMLHTVVSLPPQEASLQLEQFAIELQKLQPDPAAGVGNGFVADRYWELFNDIAPVLRGLPAVVETFKAYAEGRYDLRKESMDVVKEAHSKVRSEPQVALGLVGEVGSLHLRGMEEVDGLWLDEGMRQPEKPMADWIDSLAGVVGQIAENLEEFPLGEIELARDQRRAPYDKKRTEYKLGKLARLGIVDPEAQAVLLPLLAPHSRRLSPVERKAIIAAAPKVAQSLIAIARDEDSQVQSSISGGEAAIRAVQLLGDMRAAEAVPTLLEILRNSEWMEIIHDRTLQVLQDDMPDLAFDAALEIFDHTTDVDLKSNMAGVLAKGGRGKPGIFERLIKFFRKEKGQQGIVASYLADLGDPRALPDLHEALRRADQWLELGDIEEAIVELGGELTAAEKQKSQRLRAQFLPSLGRPKPLQQAPVARPAPLRVTKTGRNEPCPCGSGKKYKKCCGR